ncbi:hypothetical protein D3C79_47760 [compost metagenome]
MPIGGLNVNATKDIFYTDRYKIMVRSLKEVLLKQAQALPIPNPNDRYAYRYDFYRLLRELGVESHLHWTVAFLNDVTDPFADNSKKIEILNINESVILSAISRSNTRRG